MQGFPTSAIIEAREVCFAYPSRPPEVSGSKLVVNRASFHLQRGEMTALIGANGSGKSTLIKLLAKLLKPASGTITFENQPLEKFDARARATRIAYVPQTSLSVFPFTALEVVLTGRSPYGSRFRFESRKDEQIALAALDTLNAAHLALRPITELSGGERQLVAVARAIAQQPRVLLLDEPSSSLDLKHRTQLVRALNRLRAEQDITVLVITHDLMLLESSFDQILAIKHGRIVAHGTPVEVLNEALLADVYDAPIRTLRGEGRTFIWSDV